MRLVGRSVRSAWALAVAVVTLAAACSFPDYALIVPAAAGSGANPSGQGATGAGASGGSDPSSGAGASQAGSPLSEAGSGGDGQVPVPMDVGPCGQRAQATHCYNHERDADETDVDCGGTRCAACAAEEACSADADCGTGSCVAEACARSFSLSYVQQVADAETATLRFNSVIAYAGQEPILLRDLSVRYFFSRNSVVEPILPGGTAQRLPGPVDVTADTRWRIGRQLRGDGVTNDAYLEIGFEGGKILNPGESLDLSANVISGDGQSLFNQKTHYSYDSDSALHESKKLVVYLNGERVWGSAPPVDDPPSCLKRGVNLDGPAVTIDGEAWEASPASLLARYINDTVVLKPAVDAGREDMLRAGFFFHDDSFTYAVDNGDYAFVAYAWSADGGESGTLTVQDEERDTFRAQSFAGGSPWVPLGPYRVSVTDGALKLGAKGDLRLGGFELRVLDE